MQHGPTLRETDPQSARSAHGGETDASGVLDWLGRLPGGAGNAAVQGKRPISLFLPTRLIRLPNRQETRCNHQRKVAPCQPSFLAVSRPCSSATTTIDDEVPYGRWMHVPTNQILSDWHTTNRSCLSLYLVSARDGNGARIE